MSTDKKNTYVIGSNNDLTNALNNIDYNRIGEDSTIVEWDGSQFLVKVGSSLEVNGNLYAVGTADETIAASSGVVVYNEATGWAISGDTPVLRADKGGYYLADGVTRVTRWDVLATGAVYLNASRQLFSEEKVDHLSVETETVEKSTIDTLTISTAINLYGGLVNEAAHDKSITGAYESSSNNSDWIKYDSGLMIQWGVAVDNNVDMTSVEHGFYYGSASFSLPEPFLSSSKPIVVGTATMFGRINGVRRTISATSNSSFTVYLWSSGTASTPDISCNYIAIGRWK